jgi:lysyl-tRNA synthetase class 2
MAELAELRAARIAKLRKLQEAKLQPYPERTPRHLPIGRLRDHFSRYLTKGNPITAVGRMIALRSHGGAVFADVRDETGTIQLLFTRGTLGENLFRRAALLDIGDFIAARGIAMRTRRGEPTIEVKTFSLLAKAIRPLPSQWYGLRDVDERFRFREVDLILNPEVQKRFRIRSALVRALRRELERAGFLEVETPILQPVAGGALAEPFATTLRALRLPLYLRIAPELYLKRLLVGGFERVFELGRAFRNEGMDQTHNPEFTTLEFYWAYQDLEGLIAFSERMVRNVVHRVIGDTTISFRGNSVRFAASFPRYEFRKLFHDRLGVDPLEARDAEIERCVSTHGVVVEKPASRETMIDHLFKKLIVPTIHDASFVIRHPIGLSPLAKACEDDRRLASRFQLIAGGLELVNAYAELNDPLEQRRRFREQIRRRKKGNRETHPHDEDFLISLEYGMPPAAGFGLGVDRFVMLLSDAPSLREVIFFPTMRPKRKKSD